MSDNTKWTIYTSIHLLEYCVYSWRNHMYPHIDGFTDEDRMRNLFWYYINYGHQPKAPEVLK